MPSLNRKFKKMIPHDNPIGPPEEGFLFMGWFQFFGKIIKEVGSFYLIFYFNHIGPKNKIMRAKRMNVPNSIIHNYSSQPRQSYLACVSTSHSRIPGFHSGERSTNRGGHLLGFSDSHFDTGRHVHVASLKIMALDRGTNVCRVVESWHCDLLLNENRFWIGICSDDVLADKGVSRGGNVAM
jgi:hypothetical protein